MKILKKMILLSLALAMLLSPNFNVLAKTVDELKNEQKKNASEQKKLKDIIKQNQTNITMVKDQLTDLDQQSNVVADTIAKIETDLSTTEINLKTTKDELAIAQKNEDTQLSTYKERMRIMYESGNVNYTIDLSSINNVTDLMNQKEYVNRIADYDNNLYTKLKATKTVVVQKKKEIEIQRTNILSLQKQQLSKKADLDAKIAERNKVASEMEKNDTEKEKQLAEIDKTNNALEEEIKKTSAAIVKVTSTFKYTGGKFLWPVTGHTAISSGFMARESPISGKPEFHTGIDIPCPTGTAIKAAEAGIVIRAGWVNGYGNTVIIDHGGGITTLYGHNSHLVVKTGQKVAKGDVIAKSGSTGWSTGPHCHFQVNKNGKATNPLAFLKG